MSEELTSTYFPKEQSIRYYLNSIYIRMRDGVEIDEEETISTYKHYKQFCMDQDIEYYEPHIFFKEMKVLDFPKVLTYTKDKTRRVRKRTFEMEKLRRILNDSNGSTTAIHAGIITLGKTRYQIIVKLLKIS